MPIEAPGPLKEVTNPTVRSALNPPVADDSRAARPRHQRENMTHLPNELWSPENCFKFKAFYAAGKCLSCRTNSKAMILVPLFDLKFLYELAATTVGIQIGGSGRTAARPPGDRLAPAMKGAKRAHMVPELCRLRERQDLLG